MAVRTLNCSTSIENYNLCLDNEVAGFTKRGQSSGDMIYFVFKQGKENLCGARGVLDKETSLKPWKDSDRYAVSFSVKNLEFCRLFSINKLSEIGGTYWGLKYLQKSKAFDDGAAAWIEDIFNQNKSDERSYPQPTELKKEYLDSENECNEEINEEHTEEGENYTPEQEAEILKVCPDEKIQINGTFQIINFVNETNQFGGLEKLVSDSFFNLFPEYDPENSILISKNRMFKTQRQLDDKSCGMAGIPDALLISFNEKNNPPFQIGIIEYECFGEKKNSLSSRSSYLNNHIIPQLLQFASAFSVITDSSTRANTIDDWIDKIINYIEIPSENDYSNKVYGWIKKINPECNMMGIMREFEQQLRDAFENNVHVVLIIDDLSIEQKDTIKNIINSFKLASKVPVAFDTAIVKLVQKINIVDDHFEYGLATKSYYDEQKIKK